MIPLKWRFFKSDHGTNVAKYWETVTKDQDTLMEQSDVHESSKVWSTLTFKICQHYSSLLNLEYAPGRTTTSTCLAWLLST